MGWRNRILWYSPASGMRQLAASMTLRVMSPEVVDGRSAGLELVFDPPGA